ncbi:MAG: 5'-nucleotidase C-terminal domain-containing protein [Acidobacteriia bacterium]|nr:5'-nucleotidase C-terminal domain-containing protein [Terriglobia bacterium]
MKRVLVVIALLALAGPPEGGHHVRDLVSHVASGDLASHVASGFSRTVSAQQEEPGAPRARAPLTVLQINDVYQTLPVNGLGGLARVATMKRTLAAAGRTPVLILAGDFLSPSVASGVFKGEQMIATLNAAGLDFATLGNHEFDFGDDMLIQRMHEATFQWLVANVIDTKTSKPIGGAEPFVVKTYGALKVGYIGLCLTTREISFEKLTHTKFIDPMEAAAAYIPQVKRAGANVIVMVTHLAIADDQRLVDRFPEIDLIIGGHEHIPITVTQNRTLISKAGSDSRFVARIDVARQPSGRVDRFFELIPMTSAVADDPATAAVAASYEAKLGKELEVVIGSTRVPLDGESIHLRAAETNLGDFVADAMRADSGADITIINGGSIRGDKVYAAGPITRRTLIEIHPFGNVVCTLAMTGRAILETLNIAVSKLPAAAGQFPQISGMAMRIDTRGPPEDRVRDVVINGRPLDVNRTYSVATPDFLLTGGDNYSLFPTQRVLVGPETGGLIVAALEKYVTARREIAPRIDGRITIK